MVSLGFRKELLKKNDLKQDIVKKPAVNPAPKLYKREER